ncbi:cell envelope integrity protein TolA [Polaromonas sp.]|uniref:cell envelope integrity protein TolA n=1 Tax=Polaromonas sp. TaxID=1869339 RepID=UPI00286C5DFB|nr:cell envelope integrity protein TolA [Polaromonas sp.]
MPSAADRLEFGPPPNAGSMRAMGLALLVHALLIIALTWGVHWKRSDKAVSFEAELWSGTPQEAAPRLVEPPAPPPPTPKTPEVKVTPPAPDVDIALEQEKKRKRLQQQKEAEAEKLQEKLKAELQAKKDKELKAKEDQAKRKALEEARKADAKDAEKQKQADALAKSQRDENLKRMMGQASTTGGPNSTGSAQKSSGPSAGYKARLAALFKRNISFSNVDSIEGNPKAVVQVQVSSSGLIMSKKLSKSSGVPAWDDAVLRAVEKTERIPLDENGKVVPDFPIEFGPKD